MSDGRIYKARLSKPEVISNDKGYLMVRGNNPAQVRRHITDSLLEIHVATQDDMLQAFDDGVPFEDARSQGESE